MADDEILFEVETPLGFRVVLSRDSWNWVTDKHPEMRHRLAEAQVTLERPDEIRASSYSTTAFLFYRVQGARSFVCVVTTVVSPGFARVSSLYETTTMKEGTQLWPK